MKRKLILLIVLVVILILALVLVVMLDRNAALPEQGQQTPSEQVATGYSATTGGETTAYTEYTAEETVVSWTMEPEAPQITFPAETKTAGGEKPEQNAGTAQETSGPMPPEQEATEAPEAPETNETETTEPGRDDNELPAIPF